ncbi:MAG: DUF1376 domain-containing protein [Planctomycetes bacterium]|nr:DUF1376 domain-containing protein [Planctomycetota bacterium]
MMAKAPAFQLYAADFDMDTASWTAPQVGVYIRLLLYSWINGGIPNSISEMARITRMDRRTLAKMWTQTVGKKWTLNAANMYVNNRMELEREKQAINREIQKKKGEHGAAKRWKDHIAPAIAQAQPKDSSSSSSSSLDLSLKASEPFRLPSRDDLENSSKPKILEDIDKAADELYEKKIWPKVHAYKNAMLKQGCNERAILKSLMQCLLRPPQNPWAYCAAIMKKEDGNFNARDYEKNHG